MCVCVDSRGNDPVSTSTSLTSIRVYMYMYVTCSRVCMSSMCTSKYSGPSCGSGCMYIMCLHTDIVFPHSSLE